MALTSIARLIIGTRNNDKMSSELFSLYRNRLKNCGQMRTFAVAGAQEKVKVSNVMLNVEKVGRGPHKILCLPGSLGCIESDFAPQLRKLNRDSFTIIAWDPPGYGKSRPPDRDLVSTPQKNLENDARLSHDLMKILGHEKFSLLGWSDGAVTAIFMASLFPQSVQKMVLLGGQAFVNDRDEIACTRVRDIDAWSEKMRKPLIDIYGEEYFRKTWAAWMDGYIALNKAGGDICRDKLATVKCPTFVVHGAKDVMVDKEHSEYLHKHIKNSKLYIMPEGKHNLHLRYADEFNTMVEKFLLEK